MSFSFCFYFHWVDLTNCHHHKAYLINISRSTFIDCALSLSLSQVLAIKGSSKIEQMKLMFCGCWRRGKIGGGGGGSEQQQQSSSQPSPWNLFIDLKTLEVATDDFSESNLLGQGGFGPVYKVTFDNFVDNLFSLLISFTNSTITGIRVLAPCKDTSPNHLQSDGS